MIDLFPAGGLQNRFLDKNGTKMDPECIPKSIKRRIKKNLENTLRKHDKNDSQNIGRRGGTVR